MLGQPHRVETQFVGPGHLLELIPIDFGFRTLERALHQVEGAEPHDRPPASARDIAMSEDHAWHMYAVNCNIDTMTIWIPT